MLITRSECLKLREVSTTQLITQAVRPWFNFFFFFHVQSQIAVWSLKRMRQLWIRRAHGIYRSCCREKLAMTNSMISRAMDPDTNEHTVRGRPTLKDVKFLERVGLQALREINLRENILSAFIKNHDIPKELLLRATNFST